MFATGILLPGGDTPPPETIPDYLRPFRHRHNPREFEELVERGATLAFCETWQATFGGDHGIVVQANDRLKEIYDNLIEEGDSWSIWIGRRIKLGDDDPDGRLFMEDLLDLIFTEDDKGLWITFKEGENPTHWVTRPKGGPGITGIVEAVKVVDEYDVWSGEDDNDEESSVGGHTDESAPSGAESTTSHPATSDCESTRWSDDSENDGEVQVDFQYAE